MLDLLSRVLYVAVIQIRHETVMSIYSDKLAHVQAVINCLYFIAPMCTSEDALAHSLAITRSQHPSPPLGC